MTLRSTPTWYKDAIIYEVHVRAFYDSVTDGIGDFGGLTQKLDYLEDIGVTAIWLLPFCPSPLRDDGYDIADYEGVHSSYGTLKEFQRFLREAHRRGLRVITELVLNHTSDQHVWFQRSRRAAAGSRWRDYYVWSDSPDRYRDARIIFKDFENSNWTWDPVAKAYYWHRFYSHQPDLNWENSEVREAMFGAMDFWFDMGVDGLRLDAVPYLFEREGTNCENLPETHDALKELRKHVESKYRDRMLLAEANQWPEDAVAYFGKGDECHMAFHFPLMPRMFMAVRMEDRYPITDILKLTPAIPEQCQWGLFLRNHDELTLEMVTDEERDYMYRTYAHDREMRINLGIRRRLAPLLENDRRKMELMNALLFSLPGTPIVYYGDEIGMGDNVYLGDRNGVRTPMQWSADRNAGFSRANPQRLYLPVNIDPEYHYEAVNVETQQNNPNSLLWWMKRMIAQRKQFRAFGRGSLEFLYPSNRKILAFVRQLDDEKVLVVANLSRFTQCGELDLAKHAGSVPVEVFGRNRFPAIAEQPYFLSLGPHAFYWFHLQARETLNQDSLSIDSGTRIVETIPAEPGEVFSALTREAIARLLPKLMRQRAWFLSKDRIIRQVMIDDVIPMEPTSSFILLIEVEFSDGEPENYVIPIALTTGEMAEAVLRDKPERVLGRLEGYSDTTAVLYGAIFDRSFSDAALSAIVRRRRFNSERGELAGGHTRAFRKAWKMVRTGLEPAPQTSASHNSLINYGEDFVLKLYRKISFGVNPDRELQEFLTEKADFANVSRALGWLEYRRHLDDGDLTATVGMLTGFLRNATDAWTYTLDHLGIFFERALAVAADDPRLRALTVADPLTLSSQPIPPIISELLGNYVESTRLLGRRTAELHIALASRADIPDFAPEPFTEFYRHSLYHGMIGLLGRTLDSLRARLYSLRPATQDECRSLLEREPELHSRLHSLRDTKIAVTRIRHHGDLHLGNVSFTGSDLMFLNFAGDSRRPMSERRIKRSAIRDVGSMIRSFHYVSHAVLYGHVPGIIPSGDASQLERWAQYWYSWVSAIFLSEYLKAASGYSFVPESPVQCRILLEAYMLEKGLLEVQFELEQRPEWVRIPVHGILELG